ncbi:hypothetical protein [Arthrobacter sp. PAMC25284]|uniref:hypothetical protein n=1 Tax=Arthrobacter sp. PAMC25284 TaxID=2861279 RepID=UPI0021591C84|nr:hypothetical protein [Arthrobacter sp. PAMC25284]
MSWHLNGRDITATVTGTEGILGTRPDEWDRKKTNIPAEVLLHPDWPPEGPLGRKWLSAIKANQPDEIARKTRWMQTGWVPVQDGDPVFLIGDQIVGDARSSANVLPGIGPREIDVIEKYGVGEDLSGSFADDENFRAGVRETFRAIMDVYIHSNAWTDLATSTVVLAGALRPVVPLRPKATIFIWGPKGKGKSYTAECMMRFWARRRGDWHEELPGSAKDTPAAMENAVASTPIWVVDDLAPSALRRQAEQEDAKLADLTRAIFNNATKRRMKTDMTSRKTFKPTAQLILTAENELTTPSAKERLIPLYLGQGKLHPDRSKTDALNAIAAEKGIPARFTSQLIKYVQYAATTHPGGWAAYVSAMEAARTQLKHQISELMKDMGAGSGSLERTSTLAADVMITFFILENLARELDMDDDFIEQFGLDAPMNRAVVELVTEAHSENQQNLPGISFLRALAALLSSGNAHVISGDDPSRAPIEGTDQSESLTNHRLGWIIGGADGSLRPKGETIGTVVTINNQKVVLFHKVVAFKAAQKEFPRLVNYGQGESAAAAGIWDEGLAADVSRPFNAKTKAPLPFYSYERKNKGVKVTGIPIVLSRLLEDGQAPANNPKEELEN